VRWNGPPKAPACIQLCLSELRIAFPAVTGTIVEDRILMGRDNGALTSSETQLKPSARVTGVVYLLYFVTAISGELLAHHGLVVAYGNVLYLIPNFFYAAVAVLFYFMFKPVSNVLSFLAALLSLAGCTIASLDIFHLAPARFSPLIFFGPYCILLGYLIYRSTFLPRTIGVLMMLAGVGWVVSVLPEIGKAAFPLVVPVSILAEAALMLWLLIKGVREDRWKEMALAYSS